MTTTQDWIDRMREHFYIGCDVEQLTSSMSESLKGLRPDLAEVTKAFIHNVSAAVEVASLPFVIVTGLVHSQRQHGLHFAEMVRDGVFNPQMDSDEKKARTAEAVKRADEKFASHAEQASMVEQIARTLLKGHEGHLKLAARELLTQSIVLLWSAFEVLSHDSLVGYLNGHPEAVRKLMENERILKRMNISRIPLELLAEYGFDVSGCMGTIVVSQQDISDLATTRGMYGTLFPEDAELHTILSDRNLWQLNQARHLIVHRRGIIDERFMRQTGHTGPVGAMLNIPPSKLDEALDVVVRAGSAIVHAIQGPPPG